MQAKVPNLLGLPAGSQVLEAGCGFAQVAIHVARQGMLVMATDFLDYHVDEARLMIESAGLPEGQLTVKKLDYKLQLFGINLQQII